MPEVAMGTRFWYHTYYRILTRTGFPFYKTCTSPTSVSALFVG